MWPLLITLITPITPIQKTLSSYKKNGHAPKGVADQQSKNHILQKEYLPFYIYRSYAPALLGLFGALWELSQVKQCATLKTFPKSRINPNCRVIQIVTLFICVGAVTAPCCLRMRGNTSRASNGELLPSAWSRCTPASLRCCHPSPYKWQGAFISFLS